MPNQACRKTILEKISIVRRAASHIYGVTKALNISTMHRSGEVDPQQSYRLKGVNDPLVQLNLKRLYQECSGNACYDAIKILLFFIKENDAYGQGKQCNVLKLIKKGREGDARNPNPPCWQDAMYIKASYIMATIL